MIKLKDPTYHPYPADLITQQKLEDGTLITIRPVRENDAEMIREFGRNLSSELKHLNYMETFKELPDNIVTKLTQVDYKKSMTLIAIYFKDHKETVIGMVHYISLDGEKSEFDMIVTDAWQNKGVGSFLTEALIKTAKNNGIKSLSIIILASNIGGMMLAKHFGFVVNQTDEPTVCWVTKTLV